MACEALDGLLQAVLAKACQTIQEPTGKNLANQRLAAVAQW
jgi:hypothetical protein